MNNNEKTIEDLKQEIICLVQKIQCKDAEILKLNRENSKLIDICQLMANEKKDAIL